MGGPLASNDTPCSFVGTVLVDANGFGASSPSRLYMKSLGALRRPLRAGAIRDPWYFAAEFHFATPYTVRDGRQYVAGYGQMVQSFVGNRPPPEPGAIMELHTPCKYCALGCTGCALCFPVPSSCFVTRARLDGASRIRNNRLGWRTPTQIELRGQTM